jgi:hypothetical protein
MSAIDDLFTEVPPPPCSNYYLPLSDAIPCQGPHGLYIKLYCLDADELPIEATADARHFHLLEPYIDALRQQRQDYLGVETPVVPVFQGEDNKWRFSWISASREHPELVKPETPALEPYTPDPEMEGRAYRMQVSVPGSLAERFKAHAAQRGMRHTDLLLTLIRSALT